MLPAQVEVVHWNPRKFRIPGTSIGIGPRKRNFGDLLGPVIVEELVKRTSQGSINRKPQNVSRMLDESRGGKRLLAVGSILHFAADGDTVWGSGVNGKIPREEHRFSHLDVRAVRGPLTAAWLGKEKKIEVPEVYGDPGLLVGDAYPQLHELQKSRKLAVIPNLNELQRFRSHPDFVSPTAPLADVLSAIACSEVVVGSSLHAIVVADALGVPSALVQSSAEPDFKYRDYLTGTGRQEFRSFQDLAPAIEAAKAMGASQLYQPLANWNKSALVDSFPSELWFGTSE